MSVEVVTFGCRLNAAESEVIRRNAERAGFSDTVVVNTCAVTAEAVRQARQTIRALRRERPQAKIVVTGCAAQTEPQTFIAMTEADRRPRQYGKAFGGGLGASAPSFRDRRRAEGHRQRHHGGEGNRGPSDRRFCRPHPRFRPGAERLRSPLHFLHHSVRPRQFALGADGRRGRRRAPAGRQRLWRDRADRCRHHELWRRPAGRAEARRAGQANPQARAGAEAAAAVVDRFGRGRPRSARCAGERAAADAASASVAAIRRRSHPQAHEAAAFARRRHRVLRAGCAGCGRTSCSAPI